MYKDILLAVDLEDEGSWKEALPDAISLCKTFGATLHVVTVVPDFGLSQVSQYFPAGTEDKILAESANKLRTFVADHIPKDIPVQDIIGHGSIYKEIVAAAERGNCDLIVMSSHRPELRDYVLGPNAEKVARHTNRSVLIVRNHEAT